MNTRFLLLIFAAMLFGCETTPEVEEQSTDVAVEDQSTELGDSGAQTYGTGDETQSRISELDDPQSPLSVRIIYFEYDSSDIRPEYRETIQAHAAYLSTHQNVTITLEGHADERGSREYNLALGERRAQSINRQMTLWGVSSGQIRTVSYGEERPAIDGHDESAWSENRRVEIIY
jgi:peptidoglycan-associated lipoprotein